MSPLQCPICGAPAGPDDRFCANCGHDLQSAAASPEPFALPVSPSDAASKRRRRSRKPKWYNRWPVRILGLLLLAAAAFAFYTWRQVDTTMSDINALSTLPPQIQDQTAGENPGTPIAGLPTVAVPAETRVPPTVVIPVYSGVSPGGPVRQTAVALARIGGVIAEPIGAEPPETVAAASGSPVAATPVPTPASGETQAEQMMAGGMTFDTGPAQTALAEASELQKRTPTPSQSSFTFQHTEGARLAEATPPAGTTAQGDGGGGIIGGLQDAAEGAAVAAGIKDAKIEPMTILIMGVDARPGQAIDIGVRPDALMLLRLDPTTGSCRGLAIPRDSLAELPGYGETKINHALMLGGIPYEELVVQLYTGVQIDHYALIDFTGFEKLVDAVGGVTITVPDNLASPAVPAGTHTIDGATALRHARYRGGPDGDFGRIQRQQELMRALIASASGKDLLLEANRLLPAVQEHIRTDLSLPQLVALAKFYQGNCSGDGLQLQTIPGEVVYGPIIDPLFGLPLSYVVSDPKDVQARVDELMGAPNGNE